MNTTLPTDSNKRKDFALFHGCLRYFPAALAGVAKTSKLGNDKHNPGEEMHHARNKSSDHGDCIIRHLIDLEDLLAAMNRGEKVTQENILTEVNSVAWRALALSQELHEKFGSPLAPGAIVDSKQSNKMSANELYEAAEKAHEEIKQRIKFQKGDVVKHINGDAEVIVEGTYFDEKGTPILFVKDDANRIYGVDPNSYKSIYAEKSK
jgi:hypothetical protein